MPSSHTGDTSAGSNHEDHKEEDSTEASSGEETTEPVLALQETTRCPNCDNRHVGPYCNECGQRQFGRLTLLRLIRQVVERVFELERGLWPTVSGLTIDPGRVLRRYLGGKRRRYVNPASYFLVAAAVLSLVVTGRAIAAYPERAGTAGVFASFFNALQTRHQVVFFAVTAGFGAVLFRFFFFFRLNSAEATAVFLYLVGHLFLAGSLFEAVQALFGIPASETISMGFLVLVVGWAAWAGYRAFRPAWWSALRMGALPVVWALAALWITANTAWYFAPSEDPLPAGTVATETHAAGSQTVWVFPFGEATSIADFEGEEIGSPPEQWNVFELSGSGRHFEVRGSGGNQHLDVSWTEPGSKEGQSAGGGRLFTDSLQFRWNPREAPYLAWRWKISEVSSAPQQEWVRLDSTSNASVNVGSGLVVRVSVDTVRFGMLPLRRTLRYVYSPTRKADSVYVERAEFQNLPEVSAATFVIGAPDSTASWRAVRRNVAADYRQAFGEQVPRSVDFIDVIVDFDPPFNKASPDTLRGAVDDLRVYTTPPKR
jgi:hypothetical protein